MAGLIAAALHLARHKRRLTFIVLDWGALCLYRSNKRVIGMFIRTESDSYPFFLGGGGGRISKCIPGL